ncbi:nuclear transcription factor Y subunit B-1-like [Curcuma longa]|uniref:nuclear transcription factor Y subunit B-1-like n=1 Tax=Curcuma longa TaxID=136217 RepID=UPI003D9E3D21
MESSVEEKRRSADDDDGGSGDGPRDQDRLLPIANVGRIMKRTLPPNAKLSKEAKETVQECVSEFISFVTGEASDKCRREKRKTVNGDDICWALDALGFDDYVQPMRRYLHKYREMEGDKDGDRPAPSSSSASSSSKAVGRDQTGGGGGGGGGAARLTFNAMDRTNYK